jgi:phosphonate transport system substrate-binding protein
MFAFRFILVIVWLLILFLVPGCNSDTDTRVIDFSKTVAIEQPGYGPQSDSTFRVAIASMISPKETVGYYHQLLDYIAHELGRDIELVQRKTYGEINKLLGAGQIDLGFICSGPYINGKEKYGFKALALPQVRGSQFYQSYLIVNKNSPYKQISDLRGKIFAFTDPDSNTGKLVPTYWLRQQKEKPEHFFQRTIFTYSHDNSIMAVAESLVDGAAVHGLIWEYYKRRNFSHSEKTRIIKKSIPFGNPPVVASAQMPNQLKEQIQHCLFSMHLDPDGKKILDELMIDRFIAPNEEWYDPIMMMKKNL